ncbi:MAG: hypothetical protein HKM07_01040 [Chlamydiae bacterium]|jgi:hypothetical protein|nr:hypothetical protein [Chlamydiota bacterium]
MPDDVFRKPMKLINKKTNDEIVLFPEGFQGKAVFSKEYAHIESAMKIVGIPLSREQKKKYKLDENRVAIRLDDPGFGRAFYEVYFTESMDPAVFTWKAA